MKKQPYLKYVLLLLSLSLIGCDNTGDAVISDGVLRTQAPASFRAIPVEQLRAEVTLGNTTTNYFGVDFPDNEWVIDLNIEAGQEYALLIRWFSGEHLLMEESGSIFADPDNPVIRPDLDFATSGPDRFDTDCDGLPNIFEINRGFDPGTVSLAPCRSVPPINDPGTLELPWLARNFSVYNSSGIDDRVTKVEQQVVIRNSASALQQFYSLILLSADGIEQPDGSLVTARSTIRLVYDPAGADSVEFFTRQAIGAVPADGNGSVCQAGGSGYFCSISMPLSAGTSYTLALTETSPFQWEATVTDQAAAVTTRIGTMETPSITSWRQHSVDLGFEAMPTRQACSEGLEKISVRFTDASVNDNAMVSPSEVNISECVELGLSTQDTAYTGGQKLIDGVSWYALSIGS